MTKYPFLINLKTRDLQLYLKRLRHRCFPVNCQIVSYTFSLEHLLMSASAHISFKVISSNLLVFGMLQSNCNFGYRNYFRLDMRCFFLEVLLQSRECSNFRSKSLFSIKWWLRKAVSNERKEQKNLCRMKKENNECISKSQKIFL